MVEKINVEIALEGGAEVERQLDDIGNAGQQAFSNIQNAADGIDLSSAADQLTAIQKSVQSAAALEQVVQIFKKVETAFDSLGDAAAKFGARLTRSLGPIGVFARALGPIGIALGIAGGAFIKFGDDVADGLNSLTTASAKLGQTPQELDKLQKALTKAGASPDAISSGLQKFKESLDQDFFPQSLTTGLQNFIGELQRMPESVERTQLAMSKLGDAFGGEVIAMLQTGSISAQQFAQALAGTAAVTQEQIAQAATYQIALNQMTAAWNQFKAEVIAPVATPVFQFLTREIQTFQGNIKSFVSDMQAIWSALQAIDQFSFSTLAAAWNAVVSAAQQATSAVNEFLNTLSGGAWGSFASAAIAAWNQVIGAIQQAIDWVGRFFGALQQSKGGFQQWEPSMGTGSPGFAGGGLLGGRGTGTSDSNLAWVSRGEHIMPARAVAQPGVLGFLEALRRSGGNLRGVLDDMGRFALGGLVTRAPAFAAGGSVGSMSNVTINFPGLQPIAGLRASAEVVNELRKAAALAQVRSGGRKPSRYS